LLSRRSPAGFAAMRSVTLASRYRVIRAGEVVLESSFETQL
jgi:hypothetical protein